MEINPDYIAVALIVSRQTSVPKFMCEYKSWNRPDAPEDLSNHNSTLIQDGLKALVFVSSKKKALKGMIFLDL